MFSEVLLFQFIKIFRLFSLSQNSCLKEKRIQGIEGIQELVHEIKGKQVKFSDKFSNEIIEAGQKLQIDTVSGNKNQIYESE